MERGCIPLLGLLLDHRKPANERLGNWTRAVGEGKSQEKAVGML